MLMGAVRGASRTALFLLDPCWTFETTRAAGKRQKTTGDVGKWREWTWDAVLSRRSRESAGTGCYHADLLSLSMITHVGGGLMDRLDREIVVLRYRLRHAGRGIDGERGQHCGAEMPPLDP